mmetsp:Transcript_15967/g.40375  ORF Transcript_15967/g.40375 Transcript_15967/m.40375 type:complete len:103 (-) Transcript_15967:805-1113(-)
MMALRKASSNIKHRWCASGTAGRDERGHGHHGADRADGGSGRRMAGRWRELRWRGNPVQAGREEARMACGRGSPRRARGRDDVVDRPTARPSFSITIPWQTW